MKTPSSSPPTVLEKLPTCILSLIDSLTLDKLLSSLATQNLLTIFLPSKEPCVSIRVEDSSCGFGQTITPNSGSSTKTYTVGRRTLHLALDPTIWSEPETKAPMITSGDPMQSPQTLVPQPNWSLFQTTQCHDHRRITYTE